MTKVEKMKYYWTDLGNSEYWIGGVHLLTEGTVRFFDFKEGEQVKIYGEDVMVDGIVKKTEDDKLCIVVTSKHENLDDKTVEMMDGAFDNGNHFGRRCEREIIKQKMKELGYSNEDIKNILNN